MEQTCNMSESVAFVKKRPNVLRQVGSDFIKIEDHLFKQSGQKIYMTYLIILTMLICFAPVHSYRYEAHKHMTKREVQQVFHTTHDNVPDYQLAKITMSKLTKRDTASGSVVSIVTQEEHIRLLLEPLDGVLADEDTPVTTAEWDSTWGQVSYVQRLNIMKEVGQLMEDVDNAATMIVSEGKVVDGYKFEGYIGSRQIIVKSLPDEVVAKLPDGHQAHSHVIYSVEESPMSESAPKCGFKEDPAEKKTGRTAKKLDDMEVPDVIYPQLFAIAHSTIYRRHDSNLVQTVKYMLLLYNAIDLRWRSAGDPKVRVNVARFLVALDDKASPYVDETLQRQDDGKLEVVELGVRTAGYFANKQTEFPFTDYDFIMLMTTYSMRSRMGTEYLGWAWRGTNCDDTYASASQNPSVASFTDDGLFFSWTPAHELAHLLGMNHDGLHPDCKASDGYMMSPEAVSKEKSWDFSTCSMDEMRRYIRKRKISCVHNVPNADGKQMPRVLPNAILTMSELCHKVTGTGACKWPGKLTEDEACRHLSCQHQWWREACWKQEYGALPEGFPCGEDKMCLQGRCVSRH